MLKEIFEQPTALQELADANIDQRSGDVRLAEWPGSSFSAGITAVQIVAWGASRHAGLAGKYLIESLARVPGLVDHSGEFRYRDPIIAPGTLAVFITQSGETPDTVESARLAKANGAATLAISNAATSSISRVVDHMIHTRAGDEVSVAATKTFTTQVLSLLLLAMQLGQDRGRGKYPELLSELLRLREFASQGLKCDAAAQKIAALYFRRDHFLFLGRGIHFPIALEGALKIKETSYIHAEGYPAGEMKHGPNALIDEELPVVVLATFDPADPGSRIRYEKTLSNIQEVKARSGEVIAVANEGNQEIAGLADHVLRVPQVSEPMAAVIEMVPLQLLAYYIAVRRGVDVDHPRNLTKFVASE